MDGGTKDGKAVQTIRRKATLIARDLQPITVSSVARKAENRWFWQLEIRRVEGSLTDDGTNDGRTHRSAKERKAV